MSVVLAASVFDLTFTAAHLAGMAVCGLLCLIDWREHRLPNPLVASLLGLGVFVFALKTAAGRPWTYLADMAAGAAIFGGPGLALHLIAPRLMGFGDVKLALVLGLWIGCHDPWAAATALLLTYVLALPESLWRLARYRDTPIPTSSDPQPTGTAAGTGAVAVDKSMIAFGPYLIAAAIIIVALTFALP